MRIEQVAGLRYLRIAPERGKLARYGLSVADVNQITETMAVGHSTGEVLEGERRFDMVVKTQHGFDGEVEALASLPLKSVSGQIVPLGDVATLKFQSGPAQVSRENQSRRLTVEFNVRDRDMLSVVKDAQRSVASVVHLPTAYRLEWGGQFEHYQEARNEYSNEVSFVATTTDVEVKRIPGFFLPHFVRFAPDGRYAYVANNGAHHITRLDLTTLTIDGHIALDGFEGPPNQTEIPDEAGFADAQIDKDGIPYAAHALTGRVLVYDTIAQQKKPELTVGNRPWIVYAEHPFARVTGHVVPNFGDQTVSVIRGAPPAIAGAVGGADRESFGVNYSPLVPNLAYVMNRFKSEIAVVDTSAAQLVRTIPVGGNTETASTTPDGKLIVATVSNANRVVIIDAVTGTIVKTFDNVGRYSWSVTIPRGQNYCH